MPETSWDRDIGRVPFTARLRWNDPFLWLLIALMLAHTAVHYAMYVPQFQEALENLPYFNLHPLHEAEFLAITAIAAYRYGVAGGLLSVIATAIASIPYVVIAPYVPDEMADMP